MSGKSGHFEQLIISKELFEKIRDWQDIDKADFDSLFNQKAENLIDKGMALSEAEKKLILFVREQHLDPEDTIQKLQQ